MNHNIIYHEADLDGWCSGAIVKYALLQQGAQENDIQLHGHDYHKGRVPADWLEGLVYIVDLSLEDEDMQILTERSPIYTVWIDHHKSAIEKSKDRWDSFYGIRRIGDSAAMLCWEYFFPSGSIPGLVYWIDRYDVWKQGHDWDSVLSMQQGLKLNLKDPSVDFQKWNEELPSSSEFLSQCLHQGNNILKFIRKEAESYCKNAFEVEFEGYTFIAVNRLHINSEFLRSVAKSHHHGIMAFGYTGKIWKFSIYQNEAYEHKIDMSAIAKNWNGGGHAGAAGFTVEDLDMVLNWKFLNSNP